MASQWKIMFEPGVIGTVRIQVHAAFDNRLLSRCSPRVPLGCTTAPVTTGSPPPFRCILGLIRLFAMEHLFVSVTCALRDFAQISPAPVIITRDRCDDENGRVLPYHASGT